MHLPKPHGAHFIIILWHHMNTSVHSDTKMTIILPLYLVSKIYTALSMNRIQSGPENENASTFNNNELSDIARLKLLSFHGMSILMLNNNLVNFIVTLVTK